MDTTGEERPVPFPNDTQVPVDTSNTGPEDACVAKSVNNDMKIPPTSEKGLQSGCNGGSLTWVSEDTKERDNFRRMRLNIGYVAPKSPFMPADMKEWLDHRVGMLEDDTRRLNRGITLSQTQKTSRCKDKIGLRFREKVSPDFRSTVLGLPTIWRPDELENPSKVQAPWPDPSERKHEGYQRVRSGYSRFLPLPRVPGNPTVNWKQRSPVATYDLDQVGRPIVMQDTSTGDNWAMQSLIGEFLRKEIDS